MVQKITDCTHGPDAAGITYLGNITSHHTCWGLTSLPGREHHTNYCYLCARPASDTHPRELDKARALSTALQAGRHCLSSAAWDKPALSMHFVSMG